MLDKTPFLLVNKFLVTRQGRPAYFQKFHSGLNVLSGPNASGKSTIVELLFYALGGDTPKWKPEATLCDSTYVECSLSGNIVTLRREIVEKGNQPMDIAWSPLDKARQDAIKGWERYSYAATANRESFSQVILRALGLPGAFTGNLTNRITLHQILRLLYVDQITPFNQIFRYEDFDPQQIREAIGDLMLGLFNSEKFELQEQRKALTTDLASAKSDLKSAEVSLYETSGASDIDQLSSLRAQLEEQKDQHRRRIQHLEENKHPISGSETSGNGLPLVRASLATAKIEEQRILETLRNQELEIADSNLFMSGLILRQKSLSESRETKMLLSEIDFHLCPACLNELPSRPANHCPVCDSTEYGSAYEKNLSRLQNEIHMQLRESRSLQRSRLQERDSLVEQSKEIRASVASLQERYDDLVQSVTTTMDALEKELNRELGYIERQITEIELSMRLGQRVADLTMRVNKTVGHIAEIDSQLSNIQRQLVRPRKEIESAISKSAAELLRKDLHKEDEFLHAKNVEFSFSNNVMSVDGKFNFAASSNVFLKNAIHAALLKVSCDRPDMLYPKFCLMDNTEDKGMQEDRSHNFQNLLRDLSDSIPIQHQLIVTTSKLSPDLEGTKYVRDTFTTENKSLDIDFESAQLTL